MEMTSPDILTYFLYQVEGDNPMDVEMTSPDDPDTTQNPLLLQLFVDARSVKKDKLLLKGLLFHL